MTSSIGAPWQQVSAFTVGRACTGGNGRIKQIKQIVSKRGFLALVLWVLKGRNGCRVIIRIETGHSNLVSCFGPRIRALARYFTSAFTSEKYTLASALILGPNHDTRFEWPVLILQSSRPRCHVACSGTHGQRRKLLPMRACLYGSAVGLEADVHWSGDLPTVHPSHVKTHLYSRLWTWPEGGYSPNQRSRWKHAFWRY